MIDTRARGSGSSLMGNMRLKICTKCSKEPNQHNHGTVESISYKLFYNWDKHNRPKTRAVSNLNLRTKNYNSVLNFNNSINIILKGI